MKTNVGSSAPKKAFHNLGHDVNTSSNFGFCQPILMRELIAQDSVSLRIAEIVRLNPLVSPTFGDVKIHTYTSFVAIEDIFHPFPNLMLGKPYKGSSGFSYIPEEVPHIMTSALWHLLMLNSTIWAYDDANQQSANDITYDPDNDSFENFTYQSNLYTEWEHDLGDVFDGDGLPYEYFRQRLYTLGYDEHLSHLTFIGKTNDVQGVANLDGFDWVFRGTNYIFCGRYNRTAKLLRKVFLGLGYQLNSSDVTLNSLPLFAFYKVYFDLFAVQRDKTWKDTPAYCVLEYCEQNGVSNLHYIAVPGRVPAEVQQALGYFFADLCDCYYTINPDYASAHITGVSTDSANTGSFDAIGYDSQIDAIGKNVGPNDQVAADLNGIGNLSNSSVGRDIQDRLTIYLNKVTAIGGRIGVGMRALYHSDYDGYDSVYLGSSKCSVDIGPVFATNDSVDVTLGDYAGQGIGSTQGDKLQFIAKKEGYLISLLCVIPHDSKMSQGVDPNLFHLKRWDWFNDKMDARTLLPTRKMAIYGNQEILIKSKGIEQGFAAGFGNIPNYSEYKVMQNICNGDMSLPSTRSTYLPFNLDKILPYRDSYISTSGSKVSVLKPLNMSIITCGDFWRYIGKYNWFGQFDRIFRNSGKNDDTWYLRNQDDIDDNFIIQAFVDLKIHSFAKSLSDSFETGENENDTISVQKA